MEFHDVADAAVPALIGGMIGGAATPFVGQIGSSMLGAGSGFYTFLGLNAGGSANNGCSVCHW